MIYFRIAQKHNQSSTWKWKSTVLTSLETVFKFLKMYDRAPKDSFRVFFSSSAEAMNEMLHRENKGLVSNSVTAQQLLNGEKRISILEVTRLESELGIRDNKRSAPNTTIAEQPLNKRKVSVLETTRLEFEHSTNEDHDTPYTFTLPTSMPQTLAWASLLARVHRGELEP